MLGTGWVRSPVGECRGACQAPGALALRGSQTRLPCTHQRGNLRVPPRAAPSRLEALKAASAPGMGWAGRGPPPRAHPTKPCCITSRLPCLIKEHLFYFAYILLGQKMRRNNRPRKESHSETLFHLWEAKDNRMSRPSTEEFNGGAGLRMSPVPQTRARRRKHADSHFPVLPRSSLPLSDQLRRRNLRAWWGFSASNTIPSANPTRATTSACWKARLTTAWAKVGRTNPKSWPNVIRDL